MPAPFSDTVMDHFFHPRNVGSLPQPCGEGEAADKAHGVTMRIYLTIDDGYVQEARFQTFGCVPAIAAGSVTTEWIRGRSVAEALAFTSDQLTHDLGGLPPERRFCADLTIQALRAALEARPKRPR